MNPEIKTFDCRKRSIYPRKCEKCSRILKYDSSYEKHKNACAKEKIVYPRTCVKCNRCYSSQTSFSRHKKKCNLSYSKVSKSLATLNSNDSAQDLKPLYTCNPCGASYSKMCSLERHSVSCTGKVPHAYFQCVFSGCNKSFSRLQLLCKHMYSEHGDRCVEDFIFESRSAFQQWMETEEISTFTSFKKVQGDKKIGNKVFYYYSCNFYKPINFPRLTSRRNIKGTIPDFKCPVRIYGTEENGIVRVAYFSRHSHETSFENTKFWRLKKRNLIKNNKCLKVKTKSDFELENKCDTYVCTSETTEHTAESCKKLASQLIKFLKNPKIPNNMLNNIYITLNGLVSECRATIENDVNVKKMSNRFPHNKKISRTKQVNVSKKRKLKSVAPNNLPTKSIKLSDKLHTFDPSITNNEPFMLPLNDNILEPVVSVNDYHLNVLELKSIDPSISDEEVENLKLYSSHFRKGWLYDSVINCFISKILNNSPNILFIDSVVSQTISTNGSSQLYFPHPPNLAKYLLIPLCINSHWILVVADIPEKIFNIYDPLNENFSNSYLKNILNIGAVLNKYLEGNYLWKVMSPPHDLQKDVMSCGVYICYYVYQLCNLQNMNQSLNTFEFRKFIYNTLMGD